MNYYTYIYLFTIILAIYIGGSVWKMQKSISGLFFFFFTVSTSCWFLLYYIYFSGYLSPDQLTFISRSAFFIGVLAGYFLLFFIYLFGDKKYKFTNTHIVSALIFILSVAYLYLDTTLIIQGLIFSEVDRVYREVEGRLFYVHIMLHAIWMIGLFPISISSLARQDSLDRVRLQSILFSAAFVFFVLILLQLVLPFFQIWIFEKEIIFLYVFFVFSVFIFLRRYYFSYLGYGIGKGIILISSVSIAMIVLWFIKELLQYVNPDQYGFWYSSNEYSPFDTILVFLAYFPIKKVLEFFFLGTSQYEILIGRLQELKDRLAQIGNIEDLNKSLKSSLHHILTTRNAYVKIFSKGSNDKVFTTIDNFFLLYPKEKVFINDIVFIQTHKIFAKNQSYRENIPKEIFLIFPLYNLKNQYIGYLALERKRLGDFFTLEEIGILKEFALFLQIQLKYIHTYDALQDLTVSLDRKVDEKTIAYNDLINKQKEFISMISHEIKSPISAAIFQSDSMLDDIDAPSYKKEKIKEELQILNSQLVRTGGLLSKLFSVQYYDTHSVNLFLEKVHFPSFLEHEIDLFAHMNTDIAFRSDIDADIGFVSLDKIQFQQVISNLLDNAVKFLANDHPIIHISARKVDTTLELVIEDNGKGFEGVEIKDIFDKYTTGSTGSTGLGMGLYLCKKIITMHHGTIEGSFSQKYKGARFTIVIPIK